MSPSPRTGAKTAERAPHDDPCRSCRDPLALVAALSFGEPRVEQSHALAEAGPEASESLRSECDLRYEDDRAQSALERFSAGAQIDLRLPAPRGAVEEKRPALAVHRRRDALQRGLLGRGQLFGNRLRG